ncbi:MAG: hypothetical protein BGO69_06200 [Bacteroidetes bacterium 46-16]|nr:MAG: hypothetical protein BGO69_06200 [Bacteroidetes bacterium 46-16]
MEDLYLKFDEILKFFTTDTSTGLPHKVGKFICIPLSTSAKEHAGYLISKNTEFYFFPAASMAHMSDNDIASFSEMEAFIEEKWNERTVPSLN